MANGCLRSKNDFPDDLWGQDKTYSVLRIAYCVLRIAYCVRVRGVRGTRAQLALLARTPRTYIRQPEKVTYLSRCAGHLALSAPPSPLSH